MAETNASSRRHRPHPGLNLKFSGKIQASVCMSPLITRSLTTLSLSPDEPPPATPAPSGSVADIIRYQVPQDVVLVAEDDLDSLLKRGVGDYSFVFEDEARGRRRSGDGRVILGKGKFSAVLLASKDDTQYALKHTPLQSHHPLIATRLLREPTILAQLLPHPNLVKVYETIRTPGHFYLVEENLSDYITLEALIAAAPGGMLTCAQTHRILSQLCAVVRSLHEPLRVCHRDIKPENILVHASTLSLKLLDLGLATHYSSSQPKLTTCCGSPAYHSPELWKALRDPSGGLRYWGPEIDIWCVGLTTLRCLSTSKFPLGVSHQSLRSFSEKITDALVPIQDEALKAVIKSFLDLNGERRMEAFTSFCESVPKMSPDEYEELVRTAKKEFKTTTFLPTEPKYFLDLQLVNRYSDGQSRSRTLEAFVDVADAPFSAQSSDTNEGLSSSISTNSTTSSYVTTPSDKQLTLEDKASAYPFPHAIEVVLLNNAREPLRRCVSFVKYALRCAGILYHVVQDTNTITYLQCAIPLPVERSAPYSKASSALIAALTSKKPPAKTKEGKKKKEKIEALSFYLSIESRTTEELPTGKPRPPRLKHRSMSRSKGVDAPEVPASLEKIDESDETLTTEHRTHPPTHAHHSHHGTPQRPHHTRHHSTSHALIVLTLSDRRAYTTVRDAIDLKDTPASDASDISLSQQSSNSDLRGRRAPRAHNDHLRQVSVPAYERSLSAASSRTLTDEDIASDSTSRRRRRHHHRHTRHHSRASAPSDSGTQATVSGTNSLGLSNTPTENVLQ